MGQTQLKGNNSLKKYKGKLIHAKKEEKIFSRKRSVLKIRQGLNILRTSRKETLTDAQINLISRGLKFIPVSKTINKNKIRRQLLLDFEHFARRMRLKYVFHGKNKEIHPFYVKSNWNPPVQPSVGLERYLE